MKLKERINTYLNDFEYRLIIKENEIDIINYDEIIDFKSHTITIRDKDKIIIIEGKNLTINKMLDNEVLINGNISNIRIN